MIAQNQTATIQSCQIKKIQKNFNFCIFFCLYLKLIILSAFIIYYNKQTIILSNKSWSQHASCTQSR